MKKLLCLLLLIPSLVFAQKATLTAPITHPAETDVIVSNIALYRLPANNATIDVSFQDAGSNDVRIVSYAVPDSAHPGATVAGLITAMMTVKATETGSNARKLNFRILGFLQDNSYLPTVTLAP